MTPLPMGVGRKGRWWEITNRCISCSARAYADPGVRKKEDSIIQWLRDHHFGKLGTHKRVDYSFRTPCRVKLLSPEEPLVTTPCLSFKKQLEMLMHTRLYRLQVCLDVPPKFHEPIS